MVEPYPSEKYEFVNWDNDILNWMEKWNSCSKPPTRISWSFIDQYHDIPVLYHIGCVIMRLYIPTNSTHWWYISVILYNIVILIYQRLPYTNGLAMTVETISKKTTSFLWQFGKWISNHHDRCPHALEITSPLSEVKRNMCLSLKSMVFVWVFQRVFRIPKVETCWDYFGLNFPDCHTI